MLQGLGEIEQESLEGKKKGVHQQLVDQCGEVRQQVYDQVICHRIRDVFPPIRTLVVVTLGRLEDALSIAALAAAVPALFDTDEYIKYIGLSLGDTEMTVRLEAVRCLIAL